jgi:hypothetical protein
LSALTILISQFRSRLVEAFLCFSLIFTSLPAAAAGPGTSAATFLQLGFGARPRRVSAL